MKHEIKDNQPGTATWPKFAKNVRVRAEIYQYIERERGRQHLKWGEQNHNIFTFLSILGEEVGEVNKAAIEHHFNGRPASDIQHELIQVAAVCVQILEAYERNGKL